MSAQRPLLLAHDLPETRSLAEALQADLHPLPAPDVPESYETWRRMTAEAEPRRHIVIAPWLQKARPAEINDMDPRDWQQRFEQPYLLWNFALGAASRRCLDEGSIVALAQTSAVLDSSGWTPERAIADGVLALVRSIAAAEGPRRVRANLVTTPIGLVEGELIAPAPPLPDFPGTLEGHVAGAIRTLLSEDAIGLTGRVLSADGGRSL